MVQRNDSTVLAVLREALRLYTESGGNGTRHKKVCEACNNLRKGRGWSRTETNQWVRITVTYLFDHTKRLQESLPLSNKEIVSRAIERLEAMYRYLDAIEKRV